MMPLGAVVQEDYQVREDIDFSGITIRGVLESSVGKVKVSNSLLNAVKGKEGVHLIACAAKSVISLMGSVDWSGWANQEQEAATRPSIMARDGVILTHVHADDVVCSKGEVHMTHASASGIKAQENGKFLNSTIRDAIEISVGGVEITGGSAARVIAKEKGQFINTSVSSINITSGGVYAKGSSLKDVQARDNTEFMDTLAKTIKVSAGSLKIENYAMNSNEYAYLNVRHNIDLTNIKAQEVISSMGILSLKGSIVEKGECKQELICESSKMHSLKIHLDAHKSGKLVLKASKIMGNVSVFMTYPAGGNKLTLEIIEGTIQGNVEFIQCTGKVILVGTAKLLGKVIENKG